MSFKTLLTFLLLTLSLTTCRDTIDNQDIDGLWYYVADGVYQEIFFTDSCFIAYDDGAGPRFRRVELTTTDSIKFLDEGIEYWRSKISTLDEHRLVLENGANETVYYRVTELLLDSATMRDVLTGDETQTQKWIDRYRSREFEWKEENGLSNK